MILSRKRDPAGKLLRLKQLFKSKLLAHIEYFENCFEIENIVVLLQKKLCGLIKDPQVDILSHKVL